MNIDLLQVISSNENVQLGLIIATIFDLLQVISSNENVQLGLIIAIISAVVMISSYFLTRRSSEINESEIRRTQIREIALSICDKMRLETINYVELKIKEVETISKSALEFSSRAEKQIRSVEESINNIKIQNVQIETMLMNMRDILYELKKNSEHQDK